MFLCVAVLDHINYLAPGGVGRGIVITPYVSVCVYVCVCVSVCMSVRVS